METEIEVDSKSAKAVADAKKIPESTFTLSTGVVLRGKPAPPLLLIKVMASFPRPKPPIWHDPKMGRDMENPDDPDYLDRLQAWKMESSNATLNALILLGTELVSVPANFPGPDDVGGDSGKKKKLDWLKKYSLLGLSMEPQNPDWRYLTWMTFMAAPVNKDLEVIQEIVGRLSGVPEKDARAAEEFPGSDKD